MTKVKVCGITNLEDALLCCELGADALGFIFYERSIRNINYEEAFSIISELPAFISKVGVFVNEQPLTINHIAQSIGLTHVQLHGDEDQFHINKVNHPVIKAIRVKRNFNFSAFSLYSGCSILLDTFSDKVIGGTGLTFDWNTIPLELRGKVVLAGGISSENIEHIITKIKPQAVDISSSLESESGKKNEKKVREFFKVLNQLRKKEIE
ncbi:MAG: phosphoribosylanthranilate isomerase [Ignavibacteria bacterium]|nr:MAG: phosphoribosylanthranilate isomerase [Ignavibacteria bacterium]KAF0161976.1 MAG: phosphoribosylanthranilate isomerase [Ignavibacteria bacterium]